MVETKKYWMVDPSTFVISQESNIAEYRGGLFHVPRNATTIKPLDAGSGYVAVATMNDTGQFIGSEIVEDHRGKIAYAKTDCLVEQVVNQLGPLTEGWTLEKPLTHFDEWDGERWVTNESNQYIERYNKVDDERRAAYVEMVSPLTEEAYIKRYLIKSEAAISEAEELEKQALAARKKIQEEHPWPEPIES
ncbi:hypothetical protein ACFSJQ_17670 [Vibrio olivae]|uniref:Tail fiber assembly protein n=1 Tax=Vibrio olivae TaxID=1243002 RepID=A0ABV5HR45_9VIBR